MKKDKPRHDNRHGALSARVVLAVIGLSFFCYAEGWGADWKLYATTKGGVSYYDTGSITQPSANTVKLWRKTIYSAEGSLDIVTEYGAKFKGVSFCISFVELDCKDKKIRGLEEIYYSEEGKSLVSFNNLPWQYISPGSSGEALYSEVCKQK